jgi:phosphatidylserine decarboxylase
MNVKKIFGYLIVLVALFLAFFYRKPKITIRPREHNVVRSPAFGRILKIQEQPDDHLFIAIFLSPLDIHYQVSPINGVVRQVYYDATGKFELAYNETKSRMNEKSIIYIDTPHGTFTLYQIAGFLVRRIDTYVNPKDRVTSGELIGLIKFGSRVDLIIPKASRFKLLAQEGDYLRGSDSVIGYYL